MNVSSLPTSVASATLLLPRVDLFAARAARLAQLSPGHGLGEWLGALGGLCLAQQGLLDMGGLPRALPPGDAAPAALTSASARAGLLAALSDTLERLLAALAGTAGAALAAGLPRPAADAVYRRGQAVLAWASAQADATAPGDRLDALVAAALQVLATAGLQGLVVPEILNPLPGPQQCPCCGSAALAGIVLNSDGRAGLRYLECSLCGSRWHAVRARCTQCDDPHEVTYRRLDGRADGVHAETCDGCHGYVKTMFLDQSPHIEPLADDLATLALDVLVGEAGYGRAGINLFLLSAETGQCR